MIVVKEQDVTLYLIPFVYGFTVLIQIYHGKFQTKNEFLSERQFSEH